MPNTGPLIGELQNNGGPTETHALLLGSPAIDAGQNGRTATDQRGVVRPQGAASDIGAFEFEPMVADLRLTKTADDASPDVGQIIQFVVTVTNDGPVDATGVSLTDSTSVVATLTSPASQTSCSIIGDTFSCDLDVLEVGSELVFAVEVTSEDPGSITASANVSANELDHVPSNNDASESTTVNPASCTIVLSPSYAGGTLTVDVLVGTDVPVTGNLWLTSQSDFISLFSGPLAVTDPPISAIITRAMPPSGKVNLIATLTTPEAGTICSDFKTTGTP